MNISSITYSNYQSGLIYHPVSNEKPSDIHSNRDNVSPLNPVVHNTSDNQISQIEETANTDQEGNQSTSNNTENKTNTEASSFKESQLTDAELRLIAELTKIDTQVRRHEMAHIAAGGRYITSGANLTYKRGPDGRNYAVGGEVSIDTSPVPGDPQATIQKMRQIKNAALAPANPSAQDLKVASKASSASSQALSELMILQAKERASTNENKVFGNVKDAIDSYEKVNTLPEEETSSFQIAV
ncbi:MAG: SprA-related family protein [Desulfobacteraceae bacterium]|nr:SprA-related family protein [Desulfobacteraceae bacterium]